MLARAERPRPGPRPPPVSLFPPPSSLLLLLLAMLSAPVCGRVPRSVPRTSLPISEADSYLTRFAAPHTYNYSALFYGIFSSQWEGAAISAVCAFRPQDIRAVLNGPFRELKHDCNRGLPVMDNEVPQPRPGECITNNMKFQQFGSSLSLPDRVLTFIRDHPLMDRPVFPADGRPLLVTTDTAYLRVVAHRVTSLSGKEYDVLYLGTEDGHLHRAVRIGAQLSVLEDLALFPETQPVESMKLYHDWLLVGSHTEVTQVNTSNCGRLQSCSECILAQDPVCAWSFRLDACVAHAGEHRGIVAARLNGSLDFFSLETHTSLSPLQFRGTPGRGSSPSSSVYSSSNTVTCHRTHTVPCAHQKPITALRAAAGRLVTGSQDHTLRVFRLDDSCCLFTLKGHSGAITAVYIDQTMVLASGGQDGAICLWDVLTGSRVSQTFAHRGDVTSLTCTASCVISSGLDDFISIWDRSTGIKLYSIQQDLGCGASLGVISDNLLVTGGQGCVSFWDLNYGDLLQTVYLGKNSEAQPARQILVLDNAAIVCNFGSELSLVYVPSVLEKLD